MKRSEITNIIREEITNVIKEAGEFPNLKQWWKEDPKQIMRHVYWLQGQIPPSGAKFDKAWEQIKSQLSKKYPAPSGK